MKIYVVTTGENAITVSLNGEAAVAKTVKPTLTALGNGRIRFLCDDIDEEVETYRHIFINAVPLKGSWIAEEDYLSVALFEAIMNKTFVSSGSPGGDSGLLSTTVELTDAQIKALPTTPIQIVAAPGANKYINVISGIAYAHMVDAYTNVSAVAIRLGIIGSSVASFSEGFLEESGDDFLTNVLLAATSNPVAGLENQLLQLESDNGGLGDYTGGNAANTLKVTVYYVVVDL